MSAFRQISKADRLWLFVSNSDTRIDKIYLLGESESEAEMYPQVMKFDRMIFQDFASGLDLCGYLFSVDATSLNEFQ